MTRFRVCLSWILSSAAILLLAVSNSNADDAEAAQLLTSSRPSLQKALAAYERNASLPDKVAFYDLWSTTKSSNSEQFHEYLKEAAGELVPAEISNLRDSVNAVREEIKTARTTISDYELKKISAPESSLNPLKWTRKSYEDGIAQEKTNIEDLTVKVNEIHAELVALLKKSGIDVTFEDAVNLLSTNSGSDVVEMKVVFNSVKRVTEQYLALVETNEEDLDAARNYYGMYVMLVMMLSDMQQQFIHDVDAKYVPHMEKLQRAAIRNVSKAQEGIRSGGDKTIYLANIKSNQTIYDVLTEDIKNLAKRRETVITCHAEVEKQVAAALNTYETVKLSKDVKSVIRGSQKAFESLQEAEMPTLRVFSNHVINKEFHEIIIRAQSQRED